MRNNTARNSVLLGIVIVGLFAFVGIVWAAFTTTLNINGAATVEKQGWDIHFANLSQVSLGGSATETSTPQIDSKTTTIGDYKLKFVSPGDSGTYTFDVVNAGTFGAKLSTLTNTAFVCTDEDDSTESDAAKNVCKNLSYSFCCFFGPPCSAQRNYGVPAWLLACGQYALLFKLLVVSC